MCLLMAKQSLYQIDLIISRDVLLRTRRCASDEEGWCLSRIYIYIYIDHGPPDAESNEGEYACMIDTHIYK